jgi:two-component system response regulator YesN
MYRVLIVEDEPIIQKGLQYKFNWLQSDCIVVGCADNGVTGIESIKTLQPDIVITDIRMPFKDGLGMLAESKHEYEYEAIILTGYGEFQYAKQAIQLGVHDYLLKPIDMKELERTLAKLVSKIREREQKESVERFSRVYQDVLNVNLDIEKTSHYVLEALDYVKRHYRQKITLKELCDELQVSAVVLNTKMKEETNYTFSDFLNRYRLIKALELLQNDKRLVYEVAEEVGFSEYKYFSQVFKKYIGMSPKQFLSEKV